MTERSGTSGGLPPDVADVLDLILNPDDPVHAALRRQVPHLGVTSRCTCGCGTAHFALDPAEVEPAPTGPGTVVAAEAQLFAASGECVGEVLAFARAGYLSWVEVCSWSDDGPGTAGLAYSTVARSPWAPLSGDVM
ncbi:hypothetical protein OHT52_02645 [Streptomyces sp. NBC_00247]|uniref:hypothetical protein n=1 Tax=Streptomyces sp. NBC_00247 TaxID=2975689 RepID=UPI002E2884DE|nr:hypothetical protein [Streptomyces sp. NBC_00247]